MHGFLTTIFDLFFLEFDRQISTFRDGPKLGPRLTEMVQFLHWIFLTFFDFFGSQILLLCSPDPPGVASLTSNIHFGGR